MPSAIKQIIRKRSGPTLGLLLLLTVASTVGGLLAAGCADRQARMDVARRGRAYPPQPQTARVIALGTLRANKPPTDAEIQLSLFLFGVEPPAPIQVANPTGVTAAEGCVLICDVMLDRILRWDAESGRVVPACVNPAFDHPFDVAIAPQGERLICDRRGVWLCDGTGIAKRAYVLEDAPYRPAGVIGVDGEVWVANDALHRIEVFDFATGAHRRSIGQQGAGPGEFALPRGMAMTPDGEVCIVDLLNNRVQVLDKDGHWLRDIGRPGDAVGTFGRPRDVAIGPDGTVFVTDAFSQRVHVFTPDGRPLLAFGEPRSGVGELAMPNGIAITPLRPETDVPLPDGLAAEYYILVAEQLERPGVRVYAWVGGRAPTPIPTALPSGEALRWQPGFPESTAINPHWHPERCDTCHRMQDGKAQPIPLADSDALCLSCHDGVQAPADPHPIGRPALTEIVRTPEDWPTVDGMIACLTCHDIERHCDRGARRPAVNYVLLRGFDPQRPLSYCTNCHLPSMAGRFSPHRQRDDRGRVRDDACFFCHTERPPVPQNGRRQFEPMLRNETSALCMNCHEPHWDLSSEGHVDRPVTPEIRRWMLMRELSAEVSASPQRLAELAEQTERAPARLPLGEGMVTCYTCHNPHYAGLFPEDSELGALADNPADRKAALRTDWIDLCSECHHH